MFDFVFLKDEDIYGNNRLSIFRKLKYEPVATDYSILLGIMRCSSAYDDKGKNRNSALWWTSSIYGSGGREVFAAGPNSNHSDSREVNTNYIGVRPAIKYSSIEPYCKNKKYIGKGVLQVEFGNYPRDVVDSNLSNFLENAYNSGALIATTKKYTGRSRGYTNNKGGTFQREFEEYEYQGKRYIRYVCDSCIFNASFHGNCHVILGDVYWIEVEPVKWLVDEKADIALSKDILFSGIEFNNGNYYGDDFKNTTIKRYLDKYFLNEITSVKDIVKIDKNGNEIIYDKIFNNLDGWIEWSNEHNIHPIIHTFMIALDGKYMYSSVDWIKVSEQLYETKDIFSLQELLESDIYKDICQIYLPIKNIFDDILNNNLNDDVLNNLENVNKYILVTFMTLIDNRDVIDFVIEKLGSKYLRYYNSLCEQCNMKKEMKK